MSKYAISFACLIGLLLLTGCTTKTRKHMRLADAALAESLKSAKAGDWAAALAALKSATSDVEVAINARTTRKAANGEKLDLLPLLAAMKAGPIAALEKTFEAKDSAALAAGFKGLQAQCTACHTILGKTTIKLTPL
jgi:hypothetical protein